MALAPVARAGTVDETDFRIRNAQDFVDLCKVSADAQYAAEAIHFCHGFAAGAWQYHEAQAAGPNGHRLVCLPTPSPTRDQALAEFVTWADAHPERMGEPAVEVLFRWLVEKWPCPKAGAAKGSKP
jgi:hypothetical protein